MKFHHFALTLLEESLASPEKNPCDAHEWNMDFFFPKVKKRAMSRLLIACFAVSNIATSRPVASLGHQAGRRVFWEGHKFFKLCPTHFPRERKLFQGGFPPPSYGPGNQCLVPSKLGSHSPNKHGIHQNKTPQFFKQQSSLHSSVVMTLLGKKPLHLTSFQIAHVLMKRKKIFCDAVYNQTMLEDPSQFGAWRKACCG